MKIRITEIEATAEELKETRSLSDSLGYAIQRAFEPCSYDDEEDSDMRGEK